MVTKPEEAGERLWPPTHINEPTLKTEIEEERWQKLDKFDGEIKQVQEAREVWSEETPDTLSIINNANMVNQNKFDLSEFSLWQSQTQNRYKGIRI